MIHLLISVCIESFGEVRLRRLAFFGIVQLSQLTHVGAMFLDLDHT